jgi:hypothetical protein
MCWLAIAAAATMASSTISVISGKQTAKAQGAMQEQASLAEAARSKTEIASLRQKEAQEREAAARDADRIMRQSRRAIATAKVGALEAGGSMSNINTVLGEFKRQELSYIEGIGRQQSISDTQYNLAVDSAQKQSQSNLININRPISAPSFLEIPLAVGKAMGDYKSKID